MGFCQKANALLFKKIHIINVERRGKKGKGYLFLNLGAK
jgi:hypothetical protein